MGRKSEDLTGQRFGKLTVQYRTNKSNINAKRSIVFWHCICECGNETDVRASDLKMGKIKSCGCLSN